MLVFSYCDYKEKIMRVQMIVINLA